MASQALKSLCALRLKPQIIRFSFATEGLTARVKDIAATSPKLSEVVIAVLAWPSSAPVGKIGG